MAVCRDNHRGRALGQFAASVIDNMRHGIAIEYHAIFEAVTDRRRQIATSEDYFSSSSSRTGGSGMDNAGNGQVLDSGVYKIDGFRATLKGTAGQ